MSLLALHFNFSELRFRKSTPYFLAALACFWLGSLFWLTYLAVPGLVFLGFRAAVWSAMSYAAFDNYGRRASRARLFEMIPAGVASGCPKATNLKTYLFIAPFFWVIYGAFLVVMIAKLL